MSGLTEEHPLPVKEHVEMTMVSNANKQKIFCSVETFLSISDDDIKEPEKKKGLSGEIFSVGAFKILGYNMKVLLYTTQETRHSLEK